MARELLLLRHGKSSWESAGLGDHERPLTDRGIRACQQIARLIFEQQLMPDSVRCSTAVRTCETWQVLNATWAEMGVKHPPCQTESQLYLASVSSLAEIIRATDDATVQRLMLIGHNPGLEELFSQLTSQIEHVPTACLMALRVPIDHWLQFTSSVQCELLGIWRPRELEAT